MKLCAKIAMTLSWLYYAVGFGQIWIGQLLGLHNEIWDAFDFPQQEAGPPVWTLIVGLLVTAAGLLSLGIAYRNAWSILDGGPEQDFRNLGANLRRVAWGLLGFWLGYNVLSGAMPHLIVVKLESTPGFDFGWDPLDLDIVFVILGIVLLAISKTFERAWRAEDETRHFL